VVVFPKTVANPLPVLLTTRYLLTGSPPSSVGGINVTRTDDVVNAVAVVTVGAPNDRAPRVIPPPTLIPAPNCIAI
jgi:hypothetical protein